MIVCFNTTWYFFVLTSQVLCTNKQQSRESSDQPRLCVMRNKLVAVLRREGWGIDYLFIWIYYHKSKRLPVTSISQVLLNIHLVVLKQILHKLKFLKFTVRYRSISISLITTGTKHYKYREQTKYTTHKKNTVQWNSSPCKN